MAIFNHDHGLSSLIVYKGVQVKFLGKFRNLLLWNWLVIVNLKVDTSMRQTPRSDGKYVLRETC